MKWILGLAAVVTTAVACDFGPTSSRGFRLPDGDVAAGRVVFIGKGCASCHSVVNDPDLRTDVDVEMTVSLGGVTYSVDTYGQLVTSIINPSHTIARSAGDDGAENGVSAMRNYNDELTVSELIDLVAFVQAQYWELPED